MKDDSIEQLSRSDSGVRFLCLAATFCTVKTYEAAQLLGNLLRATAEKEQLQPTVVLLQTLLRRLSSKLSLADFTSNIVGCELLLRSLLSDSFSM